jgi:phage-related protein
MVTVEELVVKATPEGISEVEDGLEGMEEKAEETTDSIEEQSSVLGDMSDKFEGAMGAIVAGFAVVTAGLLSRIPVLGTAASGLGAILDALGIKISQTLSPALTPLTNKMFELARAINNADGPLGTIIGAIGSAIVVITGLAAGVLAAVKAWGLLTAAYAAVKAAGAVVVSAIGTVVAAIGAIPLLLAGVIAAILGFALAYKNNWFGVRDTTNEVINQVVSFVKNGFSLLVKKARKFLKKFVKRAKTEFNTFKTNAVSTFNNLVEKAKKFGSDLIDNFAEGIRNSVGVATSAISGVVASVNSYLPSSPADTGPLSNLDETGPGLVNTFAAGINANVGTATSAANNLAGGVDPAQSVIAGDSSRTVISIDGREVERSTQTYRDDGTDLRGRYG